MDNQGGNSCSVNSAFASTATGTKDGNTTEGSSEWSKDIKQAKLSLTRCEKSQQKLELLEEFKITRLIASFSDVGGADTKSGLIYCMKWATTDEEWECPLETAFALFLAKGVSEDNHCFIIQLGCLILSLNAQRAVALVNHCAEHGCGQILKDFWKTLKLTNRNTLYGAINQIDLSSKAGEESPDENLAFMLLSCSRFVLLSCALSTKLCEDFLKAEGQKVVMRDLNFKEFEPLFISEKCRAKEFIVNCLRIVKCLCRVAVENNQLKLVLDDQIKTVERIVLFTKSADQDVRLAAFYALVFLASEGEDDDRDKNIAIHEFEVLLEVFDLFNKAVNDASKLIDQGESKRSKSLKAVSSMKQADAPHHKMTLVLKHWLPSFPHKSPATSDTEQPSSSPDKRDKKLTSEDVGAIQEYLEVLRLAMSVDDIVSCMLFTNIGLNNFKSIIMNHDRWPGCVVVESLACLWQLCFIQSALEQMKTEKDLLAHIQKLQCDCRSDMCTSSEISEIREKSAGLMFKLKQVEVQKFLQEESYGKLKSSMKGLSTSMQPKRQTSRQSGKFDLHSSAPPRFQENIRGGKRESFRGGRGRRGGAPSRKMRRNITEPYIDLNASVPIITEKYSSLGQSMAPMSLESATPVKITNKATTIVTKKATPVMVQKIVEKPPPVGKILERESFDDKDVSTASETSSVPQRSRSSSFSKDCNVTMAATEEISVPEYKIASEPIEFAMERQATPLQELDQVEPLQLMLDVEAMENDSVDSLPISIKTAEVTEPRDSDTKYYDVNETQFFDAKMPDEVVIEKEVTEYRFEQHNKVMLSYSWNNQEQMKSIRDALKAAGFDVWMDIDNLAKGSILNNMAEAVEGCDVFVYGVSPAYHKSQACRTEAEYAYTIRKEMIPVKLTENFKPSGWLGILLGNDLYFDISTQEKAMQQLPKLVNAVRVTLNISPSESSSSSDESEPETPVQKTEHYSTNIENNQDDFTDTPNLVSQQVNYDLVRDKLVRLLHGFGMPPEGVLPNWNSGHILSDQAIREFRYLNRAAPGEMFRITWQGTMSEESMRNYFLCLELMGTLSS